jgi:hypothetical protein
MAMVQDVSLADGGVVTVLLSRGTDMPAEYTHHPLVHVIEAADLNPVDVEKCFPSNSKALLTTQNIPKPLYERLTKEIQRRKAVALYRPTTGALEQELNRIVHTSRLVSSSGKTVATMATVGDVAAAKTNGDATVDSKSGKNAPKGAIGALVAEHDNLAESISEAGRRLFRVAQSKGIHTTLGSVTQGVSKYRRLRQSGSRPASAVPKAVNQRLGGLRLLEDTIERLATAAEGLNALREWIEKQETERHEMEKQLGKAKALAQLVQELNS